MCPAGMRAVNAASSRSGRRCGVCPRFACGRRRLSTRGRAGWQFQIGLVVGDGPGEQPLAVVVQHVGEVLALADIQTDPYAHLRRRRDASPFPVCSACSCAREGRPRCARRHPPYESAIKPHVPIRSSRTSRTGGNNPQAIGAAGAKSHAGTAGLPKPEP